MRNFKTGTYDIFDDGGKILQQMVPDQEDIPDFVKTAAAMDQSKSSQLFALVMVDDGQAMKKYATADRGNTWLSTLYFAKTRDSLPLEAQKVAAANLIEACDAFDIAIPDLLWDVADGPVDTNVVDVTAQASPVKVAAADHEAVEFAITRADGSQYYPLKDAAQVSTAMEYFERNAEQFVPRERHEYAVKVAQEAEKGSLPLTEKIASYAGTDWNPALEGHITARFVHLVNANAPQEAKDRLVKLARAREEFEPVAFASELEEFDRKYSLDALWDREVEDPWYSTVGMSKVAKGSVKEPKSFLVGATTVTQHELESLGERGMLTLGNHFGQQFATAFLKNPVAQFEAMPLPQKRFIARLASSHVDDTTSG